MQIYEIFLVFHPILGLNKEILPDFVIFLAENSSYSFNFHTFVLADWRLCVKIGNSQLVKEGIYCFIRLS